MASLTKVHWLSSTVPEVTVMDRHDFPSSSLTSSLAPPVEGAMASSVSSPLAVSRLPPPDLVTRRLSRIWLSAAPSLGGILLVPLAFMAWALMAFGSTGDAFLYLRGHRLLIEPDVATVQDGRPGEEREAVFRVRNLSGHPVRILGAATSCTCISTDTLPITIGPGRFCDLHLRIRLDGEPAQAFRQDVTYMSDNPAQPALAVRVMGRIAP